MTDQSLSCLNKKIVYAVVCFLFTSSVAGQTNTITIAADKKGASVSPNMWGLFFEDINFGADGGIYA